MHPFVTVLTQTILDLAGEGHLGDTSNSGAERKFPSLNVDALHGVQRRLLGTGVAFEQVEIRTDLRESCPFGSIRRADPAERPVASIVAENNARSCCVAWYGSCVPDGLVTVRSEFDPAQTKARLLAVLKDKGVTVFADIPHAKGAAQAGLVLAYSDLVIFGKAAAGTPLMQAAPTAGIDLPMKALVWQDADGVAWLSYNDPRWIAARHGIGASPAVEALATVLVAFAKHATQA
jgi:uncharacterized protein (DUF302 family)